MILYEQPPDTEIISYYQPGGYHPVHLGDTFHDNAYRVVHKLGHGQYSTVWLVEDRERGQYASLKILTASAPPFEADVRRHIQRNGGCEFISQLIDDFEHTGPNGVHRCIVSDVLGPRLSSDIGELYPDDRYPLGMAKRISSQIARGLEYLHRCGVVHGEEVYEYLEPPDQCEVPVKLRGDQEPAPFSPHVPAYTVINPDPTSLLKLCLSDPFQVNIRISDFSESLIHSPGIGRKLHTPAVYAAPEILLDDDPSPASDVWACAVLIHLLVSDSFLFPSSKGMLNEVLCSMTLLLGKLPEHLWLKWADRGQYFDESGQWLGGPKRFAGLDTIGRMDEQRMIPFVLMIKKMIAYEPRERATMAEVVELIPDSWLLLDAGEVGPRVPRRTVQLTR